MPWFLTSPGHQQHDIDYVEYVGPGLTWGRILSTCVISMWSNDIKCKYMFMSPLKNLARKGLNLLMLRLEYSGSIMSIPLLLLLWLLASPGHQQAWHWWCWLTGHPRVPWRRFSITFPIPVSKYDKKWHYISIFPQNNSSRQCQRPNYFLIL